MPSNPLKLIVDLALSLVRWSQLAPMITAWLFGIAMPIALLVVNNLEGLVDLLGAIIEWIAGLPLIGNAFVVQMNELAGDDGTIHLGGSDLEAAALTLWSILTIACMGIAALVSWLFGPFEPWRLKRKLGMASLCSLCLSAALAGVYWSDTALFNGSHLRWMLMFVAVGVLMLLISAYCLSIAHLIGLLQKSIAGSSLGEGQ
ncbi:MAG: hypothetical protein PVH91_04100 [Pseudomonadales bacterium]|jgi:hypothetical protein